MRSISSLKKIIATNSPFKSGVNPGRTPSLSEEVKRRQIVANNIELLERKLKNYRVRISSMPITDLETTIRLTREYLTRSMRNKRTELLYLQLLETELEDRIELAVSNYVDTVNQLKAYKDEQSKIGKPEPQPPEFPDGY